MSYEIIIMDIKRILADLRPHDFGPFFFWTMWLCAILASLRGVDRRDELAQATYMAFISALGVLFLLVFPIGRSNNYSAKGQIIMFAITLIVPSVRWAMRRQVTEFDKKLLTAGQNKK
jgi:hypothetical protein